MNNNKWIAQGLTLMSLIILQGCGPSGGGGSNEAPKILDVQTYVHAHYEHESDSNLTMMAYIHVEDENGIDDIDHARVTFPDGSYYMLWANGSLFERNGGYYMRGYFYMPSTGAAGENSFAMHGYKIELVDKAEASTSRIFSVTREGGATVSTGSRIVHPDSYDVSLQKAIPAFTLPVVHAVTIYNDGVLIDAEITDSRAGEIQFDFLDQDENWFASRLELDTTLMTIPGRQVYSVPASLLEFEEGYDLADISFVGASTFDPGRTDESPMKNWSWLGSSSQLYTVTGVDFRNEPLSSTEGDNTGVIMDSLIQGISFSTTSNVAGVTNEKGEFSYNDGDYITFSLGSLVLPEIQAKPVITLLDIFETNNIHTTEVTNLARLVQTLDDDGSYDSLITIPNDHVSVLTAQDLTLEDLSTDRSGFDSVASISDMLFNLSGISELVSQEAALQHFSNTLSTSDIIDTDGDGNSNFIDEDDDNDGVLDIDDAFAWDSTESEDYDGDGIGDNSDPDVDNDGVLNTEDDWLSELREFPSMPVVTDATISPELGLFFATHKENKSVSVINISNMTLEKEFNFSRMPNRLFLSEDNEKLYITLMDREFSYSVGEGEESGAIAIINLSNLTVESTLPVSIDPYDVVANNEGDVFISSGSDQHTQIQRYDSVTNILMDSASIYYQTNLEISSDQLTIYAADTKTSPSDIEAFDIAGDEITLLGDSPYHGDHRMNGDVWITPDDTYLMTRGGDLFNAPEMTFVQGVTPTGVAVDAVGMDASSNRVIVVQSNGRVKEVSLNPLSFVKEWTVYGEPTEVELDNEYIYYLSVGEHGLRLAVDPAP
ncbi:MAG: hypothetical protein ABJ000_04170 [Saccharospirillum sp.]|uniref:hypothetical protein n=2 Tax=Saccharospirillum sp. TaxID=2033801 RepID=UPI003299C597